MAGIFGLLMSGAGVLKDQYFNLTSLLLPGNGTNGKQNNAFLDSSTNNFTITPNGNTTQGTFSPFSQTGWGNYFNGSSYFTVPNNTALDLSTGDFTIECWFYPTSFSATSALVYRYNGNFTSPNDFQYAISVNTSGSVIVRPYQSTTDYTLTAGTAVLNAWNHVALVRTGNTFWGFVNGNRSASSQTISGALNNSTWATTVGAALSSTLGNSYANGYISNVRITKGGALYTASTYTVPTTPLTTTVSAGTVSLLTCQSNRFLDNSSNAFAITTSGNPSVTPFSPFNPTASWSAATYGGSGYFDGSGDYLTAPSNIVDFAAGQAFTVEFWVYLSSISTAQTITQGGANTLSLAVSGGQVLYGKAGVIDLLVGTMAAANQWVHIAVGRNSSNTSRLWVNGTSVATSGSDTYSYNAATMYIGSNANPGNYVNGYISGFRVVKGSDVYGVGNTSITIPTAPLTNITNTSLLLNFTNAGITDATAKNDLETAGNAQISTTQSKWGGGSMYFDGTSTTGLTIPNSSLLTLGSGDWSIEFWIYRVGNSTTQGVFDQRTAAATEIRPLIYINSSNQIVYYTNGADRITASLSQNTWVYVAVVKSSGVTRMYIDGTVQATTYTDTNTYLAPTNQTRIGRLIDGFPLNGYIDDFRITLGRARTTTASPTAPFPVQ